MKEEQDDKTGHRREVERREPIVLREVDVGACWHKARPEIGHSATTVACNASFACPPRAGSEQPGDGLRLARRRRVVEHGVPGNRSMQAESMNDRVYELISPFATRSMPLLLVRRRGA